MGYPGGKSGPGVYHRLINLMPPHSVYCEPFLGGGAVMKLKRPAAYNIGVDLDAGVIAGWQACDGENAARRSITGGNAVAVPSGGNATAAGGSGGNAAPAVNLVATAKTPPPASAGGKATARRRGTAEPPLSADAGEPAASGSDGAAAAGRPRFRFLRGDGLTFLAAYPFEPADLVYCDPPYLMETRSGGRLYRHELEDGQHAELLATILTLPCRVMISGYWSEMYRETLKAWNTIHFDAMTRGGMAEEWVWFNFPAPLELHDYRFLGEGNRQRTDLRRQKERWIARLERMPVLKKRALLAAIATHGGNATGIR